MTDEMDEVGGNSLSSKQEKFVDEYLRTRDELVAAKNAGYKGADNTLRQIAKRTLAKPHVKEYIRSRYAHHLISEEEVISRLAAIARGKITDVLDTKRGSIDIDKAGLEKHGHLVSYIQRANGGGFTVRMYSAQEALKELAKILGMERAVETTEATFAIDLTIDDVEDVLTRRESAGRGKV